MRKTVTFEVSDIPKFKVALLQWARQFDEVVWLDTNAQSDSYGSFDALLAVDGLTSMVTDAQSAFEKLREYQLLTQDWLFGYLAYDLKNDVEHLQSQNFDGLHFPDLFFFQPKKIIRMVGNQVEFIYLGMVDEDIHDDYKLLSNYVIEEDKPPKTKDIRIKMRIFKDEYFRQVQQMLEHIHRGDIYEANYCQEFYAEETNIDPFRTFTSLNAISKAPFSTFLRMDDKYLLSASPERYLKKMGSNIISQPIKGTAKRSANTEEDKELRAKLETDTKEIAENIMIVDLVRNDLSKSVFV